MRFNNVLEYWYDVASLSDSFLFSHTNFEICIGLSNEYLRKTHSWATTVTTTGKKYSYI